MTSFVERMIGAAKLDVEVYEEVEADKRATKQAMLVVVLAAVMAGIAELGSNGLAGMIAGTIGALVAWCVWAFLTYVVGTKLLAEPQTQSDMGELLRTTGFAQAPGILYVLGGVPMVGVALSFLIWCWSVASLVVGVRQALDYKSTGRAVAVVLIGGVVYLVLRVSLQLALLGLLAGLWFASSSGTN